MSADLSRRNLLAAFPAALAIPSVRPPHAAPDRPPGRFRFSLNTSTIRGQKLGIADEVKLAAKVGYEGIEPWIGELQEYVKAGGSMAELAKLISDSGLTVIDAIGFAEWSVDDETRRKQGLENLKRDMEMVAELGGKRIAAPPTGMTDRADADYGKLAERYRAACEVGEKQGITPLVEVWGFSKAITRLGQAAQIAIDSGFPGAAILPDIYHLYKGGSDFHGLGLLQPAALPILHMNDYPANLSREAIKDEHRVYPGDGIGPIADTLKTLRGIGFDGWLSLELFNREYWSQDAELVARTGLRKMKAVAETGRSE
ncbi:MAG: sugar phosphate isomerase/epimerase family protein [Isosphaeraceae bacterium]